MLSALLTGYAIDAFEPYAIWVTVGIVGTLLLAGLIVYLTAKNTFAKYAKTAGIAFLIYALILGITLMVMEIVKHYDAEYLEENWVSKDIIPYVFVPILVTLCLTLIGTVVMFALSKKKPELIKKAGTVTGIVCAVALIATVVLIALFYSGNIAGGGYYNGSDAIIDEETGKVLYTAGQWDLNSAALYIFAAAIIVLSIAAAFIIERKDKSGFDTRCLAFGGISVALSFTLSYIKLWEMPQGGAITLASMLPIMIFAYIYGAKKGLLIGLVYGVLQAVQDPFIVHPAQFLLDYPVAFALTGFAGCLKNVNVLENLPQVKFAISALIGAALRFISHVLSGVFAFGAYAKDAGASNLLIYSVAYNSFVFIDIAIVLVVGVILFSSKSFVRETEKLSPKTF